MMNEEEYKNIRNLSIAVALNGVATLILYLVVLFS